MTWLYVPNCEPSPSAPGSADLTLGFVWRCRTLARYASWRGKLLPPRAWSRQWKRGGFIRRLSGLTCEHSTLEHGVEQFISSLLAIHAKETQSLESGSATSMTAGCLTGQSTSFPPAGLVISSARTSRGTPMGNSPLLSKHWKDWAAALRAEYSARPKPATPCAASDCSSWPSARKTWPGPDATNRVRDEETLAKCAAFRLRNAGQKTVPLYLAEVAETWRAPSDPSKRGGSQPAEKRQAGGHTVNLEDQAEHWAGPVAMNHKGSSQGSITRQDGKSRMDLLHYQAEQGFDPGHFLPPSSPDPETAAGSTCSAASPNTNRPSARRKLNPIFVEALMRWPTGLSGFERPETAWTRWWQLQHSYLLALASGYSPSQKGLFE